MQAGLPAVAIEGTHLVSACGVYRPPQQPLSATTANRTHPLTRCQHQSVVVNPCDRAGSAEHVSRPRPELGGWRPWPGKSVLT